MSDGREVTSLRIDAEWFHFLVLLLLLAEPSGARTSVIIPEIKNALLNNDVSFPVHTHTHIWLTEMAVYLLCDTV